MLTRSLAARSYIVQYCNELITFKMKSRAVESGSDDGKTWTTVDASGNRNWIRADSL